LWLALYTLESVQPAAKLPQLAMKRVPKRSGIRWRRREKLHRDVEDVSRARNRLAAGYLHLIVVLAAEEIHSKARNRAGEQGATAFDETTGGTSVQHPNAELTREGAELVVFAWKLIQIANHSLSDSSALQAVAPHAENPLASISVRV
jgi:hypothetical protein